MSGRLSRIGWSLILPAILAAPLASFGERGRVDNETRAMARKTLAKATSYLWSKQSVDGAWRSETYGLMKSGQSLTPFVLAALSKVPQGIALPPRTSIPKAMSFLRKMSDPQGSHGRHDPDVLDYPNYATSYALKCFLRFGNETDEDRVEGMVKYLQSQQFSESSGFSVESPVYGGWGFGVSNRPSIASFVDLAHTSKVLSALAEADRLTKENKSKAERFLSLLQKGENEKRRPLIPGLQTDAETPVPYDGGFFSSPNVSYANKGRITKDPSTGTTYYRSYATATCDGILALLALGVENKDSRIQDALRWLQSNDDRHLPAGIPPDHPEPWKESMIYYHLAVRTQAYAATISTNDWRQFVTGFMSSNQNPDGSFLNTEGRLMKEDDPIFCTALAILALNEIVD